MAGGRPSIYTQELGDKICNLIAQGSNLHRLEKLDDMPCGNTFFRWLRENQEFSQKYAQAVTEREHHRFDKIDEVIDEARAGTVDPQIAKLQIDTMKWQVGKEDSKRYGDRQQIDQNIIFSQMGDVKVNGETLDFGD
jgi:hypothetical protein